MNKRPEPERVEITSRRQWRTWLGSHHATCEGVWVVTYKKAAGELHVPYEELVLEALCVGWVDSQAKGVDERRTSLLMTPRRPGSRWTQPNRDRIDRLEAAGLMTEAGRSVVQAAKASGGWDELRQVEALTLPADLATALADAGVRERWDALTRSARYQLLLGLHDARTAATRSRRIAAAVAQAGGTSN